MKPGYYLLAAVALATLVWPRQATAQTFTTCPTNEDVCVVEWATSIGEPIINALFNTVANDTNRPEGRVYVLKRGGFYYNEEHVSNSGFDLRIVGQTAEEGAASGENVCGPSQNEDCGPAIIQRFQRGDGTTDGLMIESSGDATGGLVLKNLWLQGQDNTGVTSSYEPITINSSNSRFVFDNVVFDRNDWHHLGFKQGGNKIYITNCLFRNLVGPTQIWEGRAIRLEGGADSLFFENNTFFNLTSFPFQSEAEPVQYFVFNHNTVVNFGRNFNAGAIWKQAYVTNNLLVNPFWQGESQQQYNDRLQTWIDQGNAAEDLDPYIGIFSIGTLPARFGLETDRRIVLANNNWWRDSSLEALYPPLNLTAQPLVSDSTASWFNTYAGMVMQNNMTMQPNLANAPTTSDVYNLMNTFLGQWVNSQPTPWAHVYWDPGRDANPLANIWPVPEDFTYTTAGLLDAGTDGLAIGDLNWFPADKADYEANRAAYIAAIEEIAGGSPEEVLAAPFVPAESGTVDNAEIVSVSGFTSFYMEGSGSIDWTFNVPSDGTYGLNVLTDMRGETVRGQHIRIDGVGLRNSNNYGEYFFCSVNATDPECDFFLEQDSFQVVQIRETDLIAGSLALTAGEHSLQIAPSWGYQAFSTVEVVDATETVVDELTPPEASATGVQEVCADPAAFCAQGFQSVTVNAGGSVSWVVELPGNTGSVLPQFFYQGGGTAEIFVDDVKATDVFFPTHTGPGAANVLAPRFNVTGGTHTFKLVSSTGGLSLDYIIFNAYEGGAVGIDDDTLPEGYALEQNYPNPFNPSTTISFTVPTTDDVRITVFDVLGRHVRTLVDGSVPAGRHLITWDGKSGDGATVASGVYFYRLDVSNAAKVRKMLLIK